MRSTGRPAGRWISFAVTTPVPGYRTAHHQSLPTTATCNSFARGCAQLAGGVDGDDGEDEQDHEWRDHAADPDEPVGLQARLASLRAAPARRCIEDEPRDHHVDAGCQPEHQPPDARDLGGLRSLRVDDGPCSSTGCGDRGDDDRKCHEPSARAPRLTDGSRTWGRRARGSRTAPRRSRRRRSRSGVAGAPVMPVRTPGSRP